MLVAELKLVGLTDLELVLVLVILDLLLFFDFSLVHAYILINSKQSP